MNNTIDAIKYGLDTLNVTPKELFSLIESSKGYDGDNYKRWLANEIIKIAEKEEVGYSQLLAKWFNIIQGIEEECSNETVKPIFKESILLPFTNSKLYSIGYTEETDFGKLTNDIDWESRIDISCDLDFIDNLPEDLSTAIKEDNVSFFAKFNPKAHFKKNSDIVQDAKMCGVPLRNYSSVILYRMCSILRALEDSCDNLVFRFITNVDYLYNEENQEIIKYFLSYFNYEGYVVGSRDLYESSYATIDYAVIKCTPRTLKDKVQDGFLLPTARIEGNEIIIGSKLKRYSKGSNMFNILKKWEKSDSKPILGYLCKKNLGIRSFLSSYPCEDGISIPITMSNLNKVISYFGVTQSLGDTGMPFDIGDIIDGHQDFKTLVSNCVPLFLFDVNSKFCNYSKEGIEYQNRFDILEENGIAQKLIDKSSVYFSYESKSLMDVCKGFIDYLKANDVDITGKTFAQIRTEICDDDLNKAYINALYRCKEYISSLYRSM